MRNHRPIRCANRLAAASGRVLAFLAAVFLVSPVQADPFETLAPCLVARGGPAAYAEAFIAEGWSQAEDAKRDRAAKASAEIRVPLLLMPAAFRDRAEAAEFLNRAHQRGARAAGLPSTHLLVKDDMNRRLELAPIGRDTLNLVCLLSGRDLTGVTSGFPDAPGKVRGVEMAFNTAEIAVPDTPAGLGRVRIDLIRLFFPGWSRALAAGGEGIYLTATIQPPDGEN